MGWGGGSWACRVRACGCRLLLVGWHRRLAVPALSRGSLSGCALGSSSPDSQADKSKGGRGSPGWPGGLESQHSPSAYLTSCPRLREVSHPGEGAAEAAGDAGQEGGTLVPVVLDNWAGGAPTPLGSHLPGRRHSTLAVAAGVPENQTGRLSLQVAEQTHSRIYSHLEVGGGGGGELVVGCRVFLEKVWKHSHVGAFGGLFLEEAVPTVPLGLRQLGWGLGAGWGTSACQH